MLYRKEPFSKLFSDSAWCIPASVLREITVFAVPYCRRESQTVKTRTLNESFSLSFWLAALVQEDWCERIVVFKYHGQTSNSEQKVWNARLVCPTRTNLRSTNVSQILTAKPKKFLAREKSWWTQTFFVENLKFNSRRKHSYHCQRAGFSFSDKTELIKLHRLRRELAERHGRRLCQTGTDPIYIRYVSCIHPSVFLKCTCLIKSPIRNQFRHS